MTVTQGMTKFIEDTLQKYKQKRSEALRLIALDHEYKNPLPQGWVYWQLLDQVVKDVEDVNS